MCVCMCALDVYLAIDLFDVLMSCESLELRLDIYISFGHRVAQLGL
jgi:hypothetical protein